MLSTRRFGNTVDSAGRDLEALSRPDDSLDLAILHFANGMAIPFRSATRPP